jgi:hypothetical protein
MKRRANEPRRIDPVIASMEDLLAQAATLPPPQITWTPRAPAERDGAREPGAQWTVDVAPWMVDDGAYGVLHVGRTIEFALKWEALSLEPADVTHPRALALGDGTYQVDATVVRVDGDICVIDFGLLAYAYDAPAWIREGNEVRGDIALEIDPDLYRSESYGHLALPALIYPWRLDRIVVEHAARTAAPEDARVRWGNPELMTNDPVERTMREVAVANYEKDYRPGEMARTTCTARCSRASPARRPPPTVARPPPPRRTPDACAATSATAMPVVREGGLRVVVAANSFALPSRAFPDRSA